MDSVNSNERNVGIKNSQYLFLSTCLGMITLGYQIAALKQLMGIFTDSVVITSITISIYLAGLAIGNYCASLINKHWIRQVNSIFVLFSCSLIGLAGYGLFVLSNDVFIWNMLSWQALNSFLGYGLVIICLVPIGFIAGLCFPLLAGCYMQTIPTEKFESYEHRYTAHVLFWDTLGSIMGSLVVGVILIPLVGIKMTFCILSAFSLIIALIASYQTRLLYLCFLNVFFLMGVFLYPVYFLKTNQSKIAVVQDSITENKMVLFEKNSPYGLIRVTEDDKNDKILWINSRSMVAARSSFSERALSRLVMYQLQANQIKHTRHVLNIGLGGGLTASEILKSANTILTISEINPVIVKAAKTCFRDENEGLLDFKNRDRVHLKIENGMDTLIKSKSNSWDGVIVDIEEPTIIYSNILYTKEAFEIMRDRLTEKGVGGIWCHSRFDDYAKVLLNTVRSVFPHVVLRVFPVGFDNKIKGYPIVKTDDLEESLYNVAEDTHNWVFAIFFSSNPLSDIADPTFLGEAERIANIEASQVTEINTRDHMVLEKYFRINEWFGLDKNYTETFYIR